MGACGGVQNAVSSSPFTKTSQENRTNKIGQDTSTPKTSKFPHFDDGTFIVGKDIQPGTYRTRQASSNCYYARLKSFGGGVEDILVNENIDTPAIITILPTDKGFESTRCGTWTKI